MPCSEKTRPSTLVCTGNWLGKKFLTSPRSRLRANRRVGGGGGGGGEKEGGRKKEEKRKKKREKYKREKKCKNETVTISRIAQ